MCSLEFLPGVANSHPTLGDEPSTPQPPNPPSPALRAEGGREWKTLNPPTPLLPRCGQKGGERTGGGSLARLNHALARACRSDRKTHEWVSAIVNFRV